MAITNIYKTNAERRLLRLLANYGAQRQKTAYNRCGRGLTEDQFASLVSELQERGLLEVRDGKYAGTFLLILAPGARAF
jgi:hypothetical protein